MKTLGLRLGLVGVSLLLGLALLEIALRIHNPLPFTVRGDKIVLPANRSYVFENKLISRLDPVITVKRNSLGFRGPEPPSDFAQRLTLIAVGGSTTFGDLLSEGKTWVDRLGEKLTPAFPTLWINNAGLTGHTTIGHLILLREYIVRLKPKVVLFLIGVNDVGEHTNVYDRNILQWRFELYSLRSFAQSVARNSEVVSTAMNLYRAKLALDRNLPYRAVDLPTLPQMDVATLEREAALADERETGVRGYRARVEELASICRQNGILPIFVTQPALYGPAKDDVTGVDLDRIQLTTNRNGDLMWALLEMYNDQVRELAAWERLDMIDLARQMPKSSRFYSDFIHYTNEGAEEVASILAPQVGRFLRDRFPGSGR